MESEIRGFEGLKKERTKGKRGGMMLEVVGGWEGGDGRLEKATREK